MDLAHLLSCYVSLAITIAITTKNRPLLDHSPSIAPHALPFSNYLGLPSGLENSMDLPLAFL